MTKNAVAAAEHLLAQVRALQNECANYREFYEADRLVTKIYDEVSPGLNTPFTGSKLKDHQDRLGEAIERRKRAVYFIEQHRQENTNG